MVNPVNLGKAISRYYANSHPLVVKIFLFGLGFDCALSTIVGPFVKVVQNSSEMTLDALLIEEAIINENNILFFSNNPLVTFL